jgi:hypothetical protein
MMVHRLEWRNKFLVSNALTVKKDQHALDVWPNLPHFLRTWRGEVFPLRGLLFCFRVITVNPGFASCYDPREQNFTHMLWSFKSTISLIPENRGSHLTHTTINTRWEATQRVMAAKLTRLTHKIAIQLHLVAESCTICSSRSRRPIRTLLDTPSSIFVIKQTTEGCASDKAINRISTSKYNLNIG